MTKLWDTHTRLNYILPLVIPSNARNLGVSHISLRWILHYVQNDNMGGAPTPDYDERRYGRDALNNTSCECVVAKANEADCLANAEVQTREKGGDCNKSAFPYSLVEDERALRDFITECL